MVNLSPYISEDDENKIRVLTRDQRDELKRRINGTDPAVVFDFVEGKHDQFVCPFCGNGTGKDRTGVKFKYDVEAWVVHCHKCNKFSGDLMKIIATANNLKVRDKNDFCRILAIGATITGATIPIADTKTFFSSAKKMKENPMKTKTYYQRLDESRLNLRDLFDAQGGLWRGLRYETANKLKWGYLKDFVHPLAPKDTESFEAVIIPNDKVGVFVREVGGDNKRNIEKTYTTTIHYKQDIRDVVVVEGAIDGASLWQSFDYEPPFSIIASGGTSGNDNVVRRLRDLFWNKPYVFVAYDNDRAGQEAAENLKNDLISKGYEVSIIDITGESGKDLNNVLIENGDAVLKEKTLSAINKVKDKIKREEKFMLVERELKSWSWSGVVDSSAQDYFTATFPNLNEKLGKYSNRKSGFKNLDAEQIFLPGLYVLGGLPSVGKTTFAWQLMYQFAQNGEICVYCSYEMSTDDLFTKLITRELFQNDKTSTVTTAQIKQGVRNSEMNRIVENLQNLKSHIHVWDMADLSNFSYLLRNTEHGLLSICKRVENLDKSPIIFLDYLQIIPTDKGSIKEGIDEIVRNLKNFQRETNCTFVVISSFNRQNYTQPVDFESFKETGNIEYSADVIWGLQYRCMSDLPKEIKKARDKIADAKKSNPREVQLVCLKNRNGGLYDVNFDYYPANDCFVEAMEKEKTKQRDDDSVCMEA